MAFRLARRVRGGFMEFAARENYPLGTPVIGRLILRFIPDANTALTNLVSGVVVFLAGDAAASITGQVLSVDGGLLAHHPSVAEMRG